MNKYTLAVTSPEYWSEIHDALIVDSNKDGIPDRKVTCADCKEHSPTRGTYELTEEEATEIGNHPHVKWIELSPSHHPGYYPNPEPCTKRFPKDVKIYRTLSGSNTPPSSPTIAEENRTNWAVPRVGVDTNGDAWPNDTININVKTGNIDFSLTGKNVDVIIMDSGILQYHPEFIDANGQSRVRDIVLDGPYFIDPAYFNSNNHTYTKPDGRTGISTTSAHAWWENSSSRSGAFSSIGTIAIDSNYTEAKSIGVGGTIHSITDAHGTMVASLVGGKDFGLAFECNLWNMSAISDPTGTSSETAYDLMKLFHQNKPVNSTTGRKNPTLINSSWGYRAGITSTSTVSYKFAGSTGTFQGDAAFTAGDTSAANLVKAMKEGFLNAIYNVHRTWTTSSRSNATDTAGDELMASGVIHVAAAGNNNQRLGIGATDPHRLDYLSDTYFSSTDPRSEFPSGTVPCGHRDWLNPTGIGFDSATDFHPVICVGAMNDRVNTDYSEYKAFYSNNGPGIDVWAPADDTLAAGVKASNGTLLSSTDTVYNRYNSDFKDQYMNGTSAASPVTAGLVALHLESVPAATSREVKKFLDEQGSITVPDSLFEDTNPSIGTTSYWFTYYNLRGARRRILRDRSASSTVPSITGIDGASITGVSITQT
tara:strand:- start:43 stop:1992 length:1950 start_codon:yes stop_codon:yes gene_type:complete